MSSMIKNIAVPGISNQKQRLVISSSQLSAIILLQRVIRNYLENAHRLKPIYSQEGYVHRASLLYDTQLGMLRAMTSFETAADDDEIAAFLPPDIPLHDHAIRVGLGLSPPADMKHINSPW